MSDRITIRISPELESALDQFITDQSVAVRSRQEALRFIASDWLAARGYGPVRPASDGKNVTGELHSSAHLNRI